MLDLQINNFTYKYHKGVYFLILILVIFITSSLPFIHTDISIKSMGITRPVTERTEVKPIMTGIIDTIYFKEGDMVNKDAVILRLKDPNTKGKLIMNNFEISQREQFIHDLSILTSNNDLEFGTLDKLNAPLYKQQKKVYKSAEFTPRRLNGVIILILYFMKNSMIELHHMNLTELNDFESEKTSGGWLILVALALEAGAALIEAAAVALAADMLVNPDRYKLAYQKGAAGK